MEDKVLRQMHKDNQIQKGRLKCMVHRHEQADGNDDTKTPFVLPRRREGVKKDVMATVDKEAEELERLDKLFKKYEMNEIPKVEWLDQLVWRVSEKRASEATRNSVRSLRRQANSRQGEQDGSLKPEQPGPSKFTLTIDKGEQDSLVSFCGENVKKIGPTTFEMTETDWYPPWDHELEILFLDKMDWDDQ